MSAISTGTYLDALGSGTREMPHVGLASTLVDKDRWKLLTHRLPERHEVAFHSHEEHARRRGHNEAVRINDIKG